MMKDNNEQQDISIEQIENLRGSESLRKWVARRLAVASLYEKVHIYPGNCLFLGWDDREMEDAARVLAEIFHREGILGKPTVTVCEVARLFREPELFSTALKAAAGGVLYCKDADLLTEPPLYNEIFRELIVASCDPGIRESTCLILAGRPEGMKQLMDADPGFRRKFCPDGQAFLFEIGAPRKRTLRLEEES